MTNAHGKVITSETLVAPTSADLLKEALSFLRAYARVILKGSDKRFMHSSVTDGAVSAFSFEFDPKSAAHATPVSSLERLAKHLRMPSSALHSSWELLC